MNYFENLAQASKMIEEDGIEGYNSAEKLVGKKVAIAILTQHLRRGFGSTNTFPADPAIEQKVEIFLREKKLMQIDSFSGEYRFLSNFWMVDIEYQNDIYPSVEHAYQAAKTDTPGIRTLIRLRTDPGEAKRFTDNNLITDSSWEDRKFGLMSTLLDEKFSLYKNPELVCKLIQTDGFYLVEGNTWGDSFWGVSDGSGDNNLGKLLMKIREKQTNFLNEVCKSVAVHTYKKENIVQGVHLDPETLYLWKQVFNF